MGRTPTIRDVALRAGVSVGDRLQRRQRQSPGRRGEPPQGSRSDRGARLSARPRGQRTSRPVHPLGRHGRPRHHQCLFRQPRAWGRSARRTRRLRSPDRLDERGCGERAPPRRGAGRPPHRRAHRRAGERRFDGRASRSGAESSRLPPAVLIDRGAGGAGIRHRAAPIASPAAMRRRATSSTSGTATSRFSLIPSVSTMSSSASPAARRALSRSRAQ